MMTNALKKHFKKLFIIFTAVFCAVCFTFLGCNRIAPPPSGDDGGTPPTEQVGGSSSDNETPSTDHNGGNDDDNTDDNNTGGDDENGKNTEKEWNIAAAPVSASLTEDGENYILNVSGSGEMKSWTKAEDVPWNEYSEKITAVKIGGEVTGIGDYAFYNTGVKSLIIPESVKKVGSNALPSDTVVYAYAGTEINSEQGDGVSVSIYSETPPETHDRHWTSWGSTGNICDEPFAEEKSFWRFDESGKPEAWDKIKVLFIGNSFTFYYQIPAQFAAIAKNLGYYVETYSITVPGQTLETHAVDTSNSGVQINALLEQVNDFDFVVLQEQSTRPYTDYDKFFDGAQALKRKVDETQTHAKVYLYETWGYPSVNDGTYEAIAEMEQRLREAYTQAATDLDCNISYIGKAYTYIKGNSDINLYFSDNKHPGPAGAYLSACVHVANMLGGDVRKTTLAGKDISVIANEGATAQPMNLSEANCETLRAAAYTTVFDGNQQTETYTVNFWYNDQIQSTKTAVVGLGFTLPTCTVGENEKFAGWALEDGGETYSANTRVGYAQISGKIEDGVLNFYAQTRETVIAVWGRWITEANFLLVMDGFEAYCAENGLDYGKVGYIYYAGKTQNVDPYFLIADFTTQLAADGADIVFPCAENITNAAQSNVASLVVASKPLNAQVETSNNRYVAKLSSGTLTDAFYEYITTDEAKAILNGLS